MIRYFYLRNSSKQPKACVAFQFNRNTKTLSYGVSVCSSQDEFVKSTARELALSRLNDNVVLTDSSMTFTQQLKTILTELSSSDLSKVKKLSRRWLKTPVEPKSQL